MDVDAPSGTLKRCSSAPMINDNSTGMATTPTTSSSSREQSTFSLLGPSSSQRTRRSSYSFSPVAGSPKLAPRINQIRQEECADISNLRELAHEREIHHTMQMSQSWDDLRLVTDSSEQKSSKLLPLQISLPTYNFHCNSPSPTRMVPGFQSPTRGSRTIIRRSASPVLRPSPLGAKRKLEDDKSDFSLSPRVKRFHSTNIDRGGLLTTSSPLQGSLSSVGTPESLSSADSPSFTFRMIDSPSPNCPPPPEPMIVSKPDQEMSEEPS